ncbi:hypothetical protein [Streptomyces sp. NPDC059909]|uniref:hypothetical protein n=1 Tax=Streptomyces sp. NPDC059909 TaxID=3346998 RepID=UPI00366A3F68
MVAVSLAAGVPDGADDDEPVLLPWAGAVVPGVDGTVVGSSDDFVEKVGAGVVPLAFLAFVTVTVTEAPVCAMKLFEGL